MGFRDFLKPTADGVQPGSLFASLVQSTIVAAIFAVIAFLNEAGPLAIGMVIANIGLLSFLVLNKVSNWGAARGLVAVIAIAGLGLLGWSVWIKHRAAQQYELVVDGMTILRDGHDLPNGESQVTGINARLDIANKYDFPIYYKIVRQYAKVGHEASNLDNPGATVRPLLPGRAVFLGSNLVPAVLTNGEYHDAQVEFEVLYGRTRRLEKRFRYTADWQFFLCPVTAYLCGPVTSTNETITNNSNE